jgi:hypothetical protein
MENNNDNVNLKSVSIQVVTSNQKITVNKTYNRYGKKPVTRTDEFLW